MQVQVHPAKLKGGLGAATAALGTPLGATDGSALCLWLVRCAGAPSYPVPPGPVPLDLRLDLLVTHSLGAISQHHQPATSASLSPWEKTTTTTCHRPRLASPRDPGSFPPACPGVPRSSNLFQACCCCDLSCSAAPTTTDKLLVSVLPVSCLCTHLPRNEVLAIECARLLARVRLLHLGNPLLRRTDIAVSSGR